MPSALLFFLGLAIGTLERELNKPLRLPEHLTYRQVQVKGYITGDTRISYENTRFTLMCQYIRDGDTTYSVSGLLPCTIYSKSIAIPEGSHVIVSGKIKRFRRLFKNSRITDVSLNPKFTHHLITGSKEPLPTIVQRNNPFFENLRNRAVNLIDRYPFGGHGGLLKAMTIGYRDELSPEVKNQFAHAGIAHILAVSGLHVGILALALASLLKFLSIPKNVRIALILVLTFMYAGICGFRPPVTRAFIMICIVSGAFVFERPKNIENSIFIALIIILALSPASIFGASLQLSFTAVWGITTFYSPIMQFIKKRFHLYKIGKYFTGTFIVSVIATIITAPIIAWHFGYFTLMGIPVNIIAVPLTFFIIVSGMISIFLISLGPVISPLAALFSFINGVFLNILSMLSEWVSGLTYASLPAGKVSPLMGAGLILWFYVLSRAPHRKAFKKTALYIPLILLLVSLWYPLLPAGRSDKNTDSVMFFDVGQGDSALVEYGNSHYFLVDTGPRYDNYDTGKSIIVPSLKNAGITHLDGIFLSHTDMDHRGGIESVLESIPTEHIFCRQSIADSLSKVFGSTVTGISAGDSIAFDGGGILVLSPASDEHIWHDNTITGENNFSLVLRFDVSNARLLFTGDIEEDVQRLMVPWGPALRSDVLKVPHHGASGLSEEFIESVNPKYAVISCGMMNRHGHPAESTLSSLIGHGCNIWRTDINGTIRMSFPDQLIATF